MSTLSLREVPENLHLWLKQQAATHHRSVNKEIIVLLENARKLPLTQSIKPSVEDILVMGRECAALPVCDGRSADEILGYADHPLGLPQ
ncbi:MAG: Arc family DNA-binding protein [Methylococcaceae bacterium]|nr:MAG: Arc family DNA-binding protein [Methylococcaceae bacterium]